MEDDDDGWWLVPDIDPDDVKELRKLIVKSQREDALILLDRLFDDQGLPR